MLKALLAEWPYEGEEEEDSDEKQSLKKYTYEELADRVSYKKMHIYITLNFVFWWCQFLFGQGRMCCI